jgi:hypothetical protein
VLAGFELTPIPASTSGASYGVLVGAASAAGTNLVRSSRSGSDEVNQQHTELAAPRMVAMGEQRLSEHREVAILLAAI